ncbi:oligosaccharyl transferase glycoprotein complex, beta subunit [Coemansia spiralis]|nr:oligosaccharyl transferase glycoprotein complex, beta subunit [Coemansia spiralis]
MQLVAPLGLCLALGAALLRCASARSVAGDRLLVLVPTVDAAADYSEFLAGLTQRGFDVSVRAAANTSVALHVDGSRQYDHAALLAPAAKRLGAGLTAHSFVRFVEDGGNLLVAGSSDMADLTRKLAAQFGVDFEKHGTRVVDHSHHLAPTDHAVVAASRLVAVPAVLSPALLEGPTTVYFKGIGHRYNASNPLLAAVLTGAPTTYSAPAGSAELSGQSLGLVTVFQTRSNARAAFSGSADLFSDALMREKGSSNRQFARDIARWAFQEKAVLRETAHRHYLAATGAQPEHYRVSNDVVYEVDISVYSNDAWRPYEAADVQFEAIMLDPYIRATLNCTGSSSSAATYRGDIRLPDRYGTFTFRVNYKRPGLSSLDVKDTVAIWPLRHDEYPRFLSAAYPYYAGSFVMVVGFLALCAVWLWSAEPTATATAKPASKPTATPATKPAAKPKAKAKPKSS